MRAFLDSGYLEKVRAERVGGGHGQLGMRERVAVWGGSLRCGPRPDGGYEVVAELPRGQEER